MSKFSEWTRKQKERICDCISSFSFGHTNKSKWEYSCSHLMCWSAWHVTVQLPRLRAEKHAHFGFTRLAPEYSTSGCQFCSSQVLLENEAEWREGFRLTDILHLLSWQSVWARHDRGLGRHFVYKVSSFVFSMQMSSWIFHEESWRWAL